MFWCQELCSDFSVFTVHLLQMIHIQPPHTGHRHLSIWPTMAPRLVFWHRRNRCQMSVARSLQLASCWYLLPAGCFLRGSKEMEITTYEGWWSITAICHKSKWQYHAKRICLGTATQAFWDKWCLLTSQVYSDNPRQSHCHHGPGNTQHWHLYNPLRQLAR